MFIHNHKKNKAEVNNLLIEVYKIMMHIEGSLQDLQVSPKLNHLKHTLRLNIHEHRTAVF